MPKAVSSGRKRSIISRETTPRQLMHSETVSRASLTRARRAPRPRLRRPTRTAVLHGRCQHACHRVEALGRRIADLSRERELRPCARDEERYGIGELLPEERDLPLDGARVTAPDRANRRNLGTSSRVNAMVDSTSVL